MGSLPCGDLRCAAFAPGPGHDDRPDIHQLRGPLQGRRNPNFSRWSAVLDAKELPEGRWELSAWEYNFTGNRIHPISGIFAWVKSSADLRIIRVSNKEAPKVK